MRRILVSLATICVAFLAVACGDARGPTGLVAPGTPSRANAPGTCTTLSNLTSLVRTVFGGGSPNVNSALGKLENLDKLLQRGKIADAQAQANNLVAFIQQKAAGLPGTHAQVQALISGILCYAGLLPNTFLIFPTDQPQVITDPTGAAGVSLQGSTVGTPTLLTITLLAPNGPSPLITKLDKYPGYVELTISSPLTKPAVVGVCPSSSVPTGVRPRLRLGHQATTGFELTPPADASFLNCSAVAASHVPAWLNTLANLVLPRTLYAAQLSAGGVGGVATEFSPFGPVDPELSFSGGVGGTATEFMRAPMVPTVATPPDPTTPDATPLHATPRRTTPSLSLAPTARTNALSSLACTSVSAPPGSGLAPACRPVVTLTTHNGTIMQNVPVAWAVNLGGGVITPQALATSSCGATYASTAATSTDVNGQASVCWTLGALPGTNTVIATPSAGGDAPVGVTFTPVSETFTATGTLITPTASASGVSVVYDGLQHPGSGTCSNSITPALSYSGGTVPVNVGSYTLTVTCAGALYNTVTATAAIAISGATPVVTVTCPVSTVYTGSAQTPCTATVAAPGLAGPLTPTYSSNTNVGTATASATQAAGGNYLAGNGSSTFAITPAPASATAGSGTMTYGGTVPSLPCAVTGLFAGDAGTVTCATAVPSTILAGNNATTPVVSPVSPQNYSMQMVNGLLTARYVQIGCFAPPVHSTLPSTTAHHDKGGTLVITCTLNDALGSTVSTASGDLVIQDKGTNGLAPGVTVFSLNNAFVFTGTRYTYSISTASASFVSGHYYQVTASWNDGTVTVGYVYVL